MIRRKSLILIALLIIFTGVGALILTDFSIQKFLRYNDSTQLSLSTTNQSQGKKVYNTTSQLEGLSKQEIEEARKQLNFDPIEGSAKYNDVAVKVNAPKGTFPEGTTLTITPITGENEIQEIQNQISGISDDDYGKQGLQVVTFDITFSYKLKDGSEVELQPRDENSVQVIFDYSENEQLKIAEKNENQEIEIYHVDSDISKNTDGKDIAQKIKINESETAKAEGVLVVDATSFSTYTIMIQTPGFYYEEIFIPNPNNPNIGIIIMDRNLGAEAPYTGINHAGVYGYLYQWGNNYGLRNTGDLSQSEIVSRNVAKVDATKYGPNNSYYSGVFITGPGSNDWATKSNDNLWGHTTSTEAAMQGPCPTGWHVPTQSEWATVVSYRVAGSGHGSMNLSNFTLDLKLPYGGSRARSTSYLSNQGTEARYWTTTPKNAVAYMLNFFITGSNVNTTATTNRVDAQSIRCFKNSCEGDQHMESNGCVDNTMTTTCLEGSPVSNGYYILTGVTATWSSNAWNIPTCEISCDTGYSMIGDVCLNENELYTLTFDTNSGTRINSITGILGGTSLMTLRPKTDPFRLGYMFLGWFDEQGNRFFFDGVVMTGDLTLVAHRGEFNDIVYCDDSNPDICITLMDRNLGATNTGAGLGANTGSYGYYYQWGHNYGFYGQRSGSTLPEEITTTETVTGVYGPMDPYYGEKFILSTTDWYGNDNTNLWGGGGDKKSNNYDDGNLRYLRQGPCPRGYHVPSLNEWNSLIKLYFANNGIVDGKIWPNYVGGKENADYSISSSDMSALLSEFMFPFAGRLVGSNGQFNRQEERMPFWSSSTPKIHLALGVEMKVDNKINIGGWNDETSQGKAVRCFKNNDDYTVLWKSGDNVVYTSYYVYHGEELIYNDDEPTKQGYEFVGWNTNSGATTGLSTIIITQDTTLYAIFKKEITATFDGNGGESCTGSLTCTMYNDDTGCTVVAPCINRPNFQIEGWNTDSGSMSALVQVNGTIMLTGDTTLYAITHRTATGTFYKNGANGQIFTGQSEDTSVAITTGCMIYNTETGCNITSPIIYPATNFSAVGYNANSTGTTSQRDEDTVRFISGDVSYYAITKYPISVTFKPNGNIIDLGLIDVVKSCTRYNGAYTCEIVTPTITAPINTPVIVGYTIDSTGTSTASIGSDILISVGGGEIYYAQTTKPTVVYTGYFDANGNNVSYTERTCTIEATYNGAQQETGCEISCPTITGSENTPNIIGFTTGQNINSGIVCTSDGTIAMTSDTSEFIYYAQTESDQWVYTGIFTYNPMSVSSIGFTGGTCQTEKTYNGVAPTQSCELSTPSIVCNTASGFVNPRWRGNTTIYNPTTTISITGETVFTGECEDMIPPICTRGEPTQICVAGGVAGTISLTCSDLINIETIQIPATGIQYDNNLFILGDSTIVSGDSDTKTFVFVYTGLDGVNGISGFALKDNVVSDGTNGNTETWMSTGIQVDNIGPEIEISDIELQECTSIYFAITGTDTGCAGMGGLSYLFGGIYGTYEWTGNNVLYISSGETSSVGTGEQMVKVRDLLGNESISTGHIIITDTLPSISRTGMIIGGLTGQMILGDLVDAMGVLDGACGSETISISIGNCSNASNSYLSGNQLVIIPDAGVSQGGQCEIIFSDDEGNTVQGYVYYNIQTQTPEIVFTGDNGKEINPLTSIDRNRFMTKMEIKETPNMSNFEYRFTGDVNGIYGSGVYQVYDNTIDLMYNFDKVTALGETNTVVKDLSQGGSIGIVQGATWINTGVWGGSYEFDGVDDYIQIINMDTLINSTVLMWIKPEGGRRQHIAIVNGSTIYVDGFLSGGAVNNCIDTANGYIGRVGSTYFNGQIDEVRRYDRALTADEIQFAYRSNLSKTNTGTWLFQVLNTCLATSGNYEYGGYVESVGGFGSSTGRVVRTEIPSVEMSGVDIDLGTYGVTGQAFTVSGQYTGYIKVIDWRGVNAWTGTLRISSVFTGQNTPASISSAGFRMKSNEMEEMGHYLYGIIPEYWTGMVRFNPAFETSYQTIQIDSTQPATPYYISNYVSGDFMCNGGIYGDMPYVELDIPAWQIADTYIATIYMDVMQ